MNSIDFTRVNSIQNQAESNSDSVLFNSFSSSVSSGYLDAFFLSSSLHSDTNLITMAEYSVRSKAEKRGDMVK